jgi:hypothetical protein
VCHGAFQALALAPRHVIALAGRGRRHDVDGMRGEKKPRLQLSSSLSVLVLSSLSFLLVLEEYWPRLD